MLCSGISTDETLSSHKKRKLYLRDPSCPVPRQTVFRWKTNRDNLHIQKEKTPSIRNCEEDKCSDNEEDGLGPSDNGEDGLGPSDNGEDGLGPSDNEEDGLGP